MDKKTSDMTRRDQKELKKRDVHLRLSESDMDILAARSYEDDESISQVMRRAIRFYNNFKNGKA